MLLKKIYLSNKAGSTIGHMFTKEKNSQTKRGSRGPLLGPPLNLPLSNESQLPPPPITANLLNTSCCGLSECAGCRWSVPLFPWKLLHKNQKKI